MENVSKKEVIKNESGITLLVLVITVIVMMILIGATIINITGKEGIINETRYAVNEADKQSVIEDTQIAVTKMAQQWNGNDTIQRYIIGKIKEKGADGYITENEAKLTVDRSGFITYIDKNDNEFVFDDDEGSKRMKIDEDGKVIIAIYPEDN